MPDQPTEPGPRWTALRVGPGGVPADQVRPVGLPERPRPEPPRPASPAGPRPGPWPPPASWPPAGPDTTPHAVLGSFDAGRPRRRAIIAVIGLGLVALVVVAAALWSSNTPGTSSATSLRAGDCLASAGGTTVIGLDCAASDAEFVIAARFEHTTDDSRCYRSSSDVVLVTRDDVVLCLNYIARVGDCLYAGNTDDVGKAPCRTSASGSTPRGLFRVIAVLPDTVSARDCPAGTLETLVHRDNREVVCLGMP